MIFEEIDDWLDTRRTVQTGGVPLVMLGFKFTISLFMIGLESGIIGTSKSDLDTYINTTNKTIISHYVGNGNYTQTVDIDALKRSLYAFCVFFGIHIIVTFGVYMHHFSNLMDDKGIASFSSFRISFLCETPLLICDACMLTSRQVLDWDTQLADMIFHITFVFYITIQMLTDFWLMLNMNKTGFCKGLFLSPLCVIIGIMFYAPASWIMAGWLGFRNIQFKQILVTEHLENITLMLAMIGHIGQISWCVLIIMIVLYGYYRCLLKYDKNEYENISTHHY